MLLAAAVLLADATQPLSAAPPEVLPSGISPGQVEQKRYLDYARECIELLMKHGTDRYGSIHSPMLMNILDVRDRTCPENPLPLDEAYRVTRRGRRGPAGGNLYPDQPTLRALYALSEVTGDKSFAGFADQCANYTMTELVDDHGLFWWGWHRHYDAYRDEKTGHAGNVHEIHVQQILWPQLWRINADAVCREAEAIWTWHVIDKESGECNRHADGQRGCDFAMSGGEMIAGFAFMYHVTGDEKWLNRARLLDQYYWNSRDPATNLIPNRPNAGSDRFDGSHFDTSITGFLCRGLLLAADWSNDPNFRDHAMAYLKAYGRYGYDPAPKAFWGSLRLDGTPVPGPRVVGGYEQYEPRGHLDLWEPYVAGYENPIYTAQVYAFAAEKTDDRELLETARRWRDLIARKLPAGECLEKTWYGPYAREWAPHGTYAGLYGRTISFLLHMHRISGQDQDLELARGIARDAISRLYYRGLLRGHPAKPYYESIDGVGYLLYALIQLDEVLTSREPLALDPVNW
jgi:hypothetical protein